MSRDTDRAIRRDTDHSIRRDTDHSHGSRMERALTMASF